MASSRKSSCKLLERVAGALISVVFPDRSILLGLSGGLDSVVLLHLLVQLAPRQNWQLSALHVHHGISSNASDWADFCVELCAQLNVPCQIEQVDLSPLRELGVEAAARQLRHAALNRQVVDFVALAHHQDDQAETLLLQVLRGAGVRGAAAMPAIKPRTTLPTLLRPLLTSTRAELLAYAQQHSLRWIEDESNADVFYPRNFLRHRVLPVLAERFPAYRTTLARSAQHFAEASNLLAELAAEDATHAMVDGRLQVAALQTLSEARGKNLLRHYILSLGAPLPDSTRLQEMWQQLREAKLDAKLVVSWQNWQVRRYRDEVYLLQLPTTKTDWEMIWRGESSLALPKGLGEIQVVQVVGKGVSLQKLQQAPVIIRNRRGGEPGMLTDGGGHQSLKNVFQALAVPPWQRDSLPLVFCGAHLVALADLAVASDFQANATELGVAFYSKQLNVE